MRSTLLIILIFVTVIPAVLSVSYYTQFLIYNDQTHRQNSQPYAELMIALQSEPTFAISFKTCAGIWPIYDPIVLVKSDKQTKEIYLTGSIDERKCYVTGTLLESSSISTISVSLLSHTNLPTIYDDLYHDKLRKKLIQKNEELENLMADAESKNFDERFVKLIGEITEIHDSLKHIRSQFHNRVN